MNFNYEIDACETTSTRSCRRDVVPVVFVLMHLITAIGGGKRHHRRDSHFICARLYSNTGILLGINDE